VTVVVGALDATGVGQSDDHMILDLVPRVIGIFSWGRRSHRDSMLSIFIDEVDLLNLPSTTKGVDESAEGGSDRVEPIGAARNELLVGFDG